MVIILHFIDDSWNVNQRVIRAKSLTGEEVARQLISTLSTNYGISSDMLLAAMRDRASANYVAIGTLSIVYPKLLDVGCFSHTLDHLGEKLSTCQSMDKHVF